MQVSRYFHTVRHLRPGQVVARLAHKLPRRGNLAGPTPRLRAVRGQWVLGPARERSLLEDGGVRFLNREARVDSPQDWNDPAAPKLWLYNLHYFDDLTSQAGQQHRARQGAFLMRWVAENPPESGSGWEPYPLSLRIVNWIKWAMAGARLEPRALDSLAQQVRSLSHQIEWHLLGNHLLANAKALAFAGLYFDGPEADGWLETGLSIYARELPEQILSDGGHFELSPMYHAIILEDLLDLINLAGCFGVQERGVLATLPGHIDAMRRWIAAMTHPDGGLAFFNDAAFGIAASRAELEDYASRLGLPPVAEPGDGMAVLDASGYVRIAAGGAVALIDVGAIGPDYLPGHAHADTLSFELSVAGERVFVNGGVSTYAVCAQRQIERGTASHNTVEVDGENSSEVWGAFRVARRARVRDVIAGIQDGAAAVSAEHDGYKRLAGRPVHRRSWRMTANRLEVHDEVSGTITSAVARYHCPHAGAISVAADGRAGQLALGNGRVIGWSSSTAARVEKGEWRPAFGTTVAADCLAVPLADGATRVVFDWT